MVVYKAIIPEESHKQKVKDKYISEQTQKKRKQKRTSKHVLQEILNAEKNPRIVILPWYLKWFFLLLWIFIIYIIIECIVQLYISLDAQLLRKWWNSNGGKQYNKIFSINLLTLYSTFSLGYDIGSVFVSKEAQFKTEAEVRFINELIFTFGKLENDDNPMHQLLPKNLFEYIMTYKAELTPNEKGGMDLSETPLSDETGYPTTDRNWRQLLRNWGASENASEIDIDMWTGKDEDNNNFLWQNYQIPPTAPVIQGFLTGKTTTEKGFELSADAFRILVGLGTFSGTAAGYQGGWISFVREGFLTSDVTTALIYQSLYQSVDFPSQSGSCNLNNNLTTAGIAGVSSGAAAFVNVAAFTAATAGFFPAVAAGALITGITFGTSLLTSRQGCKN